MLFNETEPKFVDRIKSHVAKIASQNEREVPTDTAIITVVKKGIRLQHPMLYHVLETMLDLSLDKLNKEIRKRTVSERSVATASLWMDDIDTQEKTLNVASVFNSYNSGK